MELKTYTITMHRSTYPIQRKPVTSAVMHSSTHPVQRKPVTSAVMQRRRKAAMRRNIRWALNTIGPVAFDAAMFCGLIFACFRILLWMAALCN